MPERILCARFPHLGLLASWQRHPELRDEPLVVADGRLAQPVLAVSAAAHTAGVRAGQPLRQARQLCPAAVQLALDAAGVERLRRAALVALCALAPTVELGDEEAYADLSGRHAAFVQPSPRGGSREAAQPSPLTGEPAWAAAVARALTAALGGEAPAVGVAGTRFVAWMAARQSVPRRVRRVRSGEEAAFLAPLPVSLLPADPAVLTRLGALGLARIGQVAALAPADLCRQFGDAGLQLHRSAIGAQDAALIPLTAASTLVERLVLDGLVGDREVLQRCARHLVGELGARLRSRGLVAGRVALILEGETGPVGEAERLPPVAVGDAAELWPVVLALLGAVASDPACRLGPCGPVAALRLEAAALAPAMGRQVDLWRRGDAARDAVAVTVSSLQDRFGVATVLRPRLALDPGDLPERRFRWEAGDPALAAGMPWVTAGGISTCPALPPAPPDGTTRRRPPLARATRRA